ncbi:hypothetical protein AVEN_55510-1 [Araneus ventricosus]|uniref:Uncharacterized protein n=1 Tax=Araneus ventricosus TaxID=182803 RepID=A0A4Y2CB80_ARAVE|nr:hypothetical protein AVEN_55510-1 [Araneus ventricosus]
MARFWSALGRALSDLIGREDPRTHSISGQKNPPKKQWTGLWKFVSAARDNQTLCLAMYRPKQLGFLLSAMDAENWSCHYALFV